RTMSQNDHSKYCRREFLRLSWTLGAGLVLPASLHGCGSGRDSAQPLPVETFVEPITLASASGELNVALTLAYYRTMLYDRAVTLRSMNNSIPAPTLRVNVGDRLRIQVV